MKHNENVLQICSSEYHHDNQSCITTLLQSEHFLGVVLVSVLFVNISVPHGTGICIICYWSVLHGTCLCTIWYWSVLHGTGTGNCTICYWSVLHYTGICISFDTGLQYLRDRHDNILTKQSDLKYINDTLT